jgi:M6 family metalloprotease-like protein
MKTLLKGEPKMAGKLRVILMLFLLCLSLILVVPVNAQEEKFEWGKPMPMTGPQKTLVLMIEFSDVKFSNPQKAEQVVKMLNDFIKRSSYGKAWLDYYIYPKVITLPKPMSYYGAPEPGNQRGDGKGSNEYLLATIKFIKEKSGLDITEFKHIIMIHAGSDEAISGSPNDLWSFCACGVNKLLHFLIEKYGFDEVEDYLLKNGYDYIVELYMHRKKDGTGHLLNGIETVAEEDMPSVMMHEFTHSLWISDLYVYAEDGYSAGSEVGVWSNMDYGPFLDPPVDIDGWSKYLLGWIEVTEVKNDGKYTIHTLDKAEEPHALIIPINDEEYYFIHARRPTGQDAALPGPGVLVFRINKYLNRNVKEHPFMCKMLDAHPDTPPECPSMDEHHIRLCEGLDAPYIGPDGYRGTWRRFQINLINGELKTEEGYYIKVLDFDEKKGVAKILVSISGEAPTETTTMTETTEVTRTPVETITQTKTITQPTTIMSKETVTHTQIVTATVTETVAREELGVLSYGLIAISIVLILALIIVARRRRAPPPPPPAYPSW